MQCVDVYQMMECVTCFVLVVAGCRTMLMDSFKPLTLRYSIITHEYFVFQVQSWQFGLNKNHDAEGGIRGPALLLVCNSSLLDGLTKWPPNMSSLCMDN